MKFLKNMRRAGVFILILTLVSFVLPEGAFADASSLDYETGAQETVEQVGEPYVMSGDDIRSVDFKVLRDGQWVTPQSSETISKNSDVKFIIHYAIPAGALTQEKNTAVYTLPDAISGFSDTGTIKDGDQVVGTFEVKDGVAKLIFKKDFIKEHSADGIMGLFQASGKASDIKTDKSGAKEADVPFNAGSTVHIKFSNDKPDVSVSKVGEPGKDGTFTYQITVTSDNGTNDPVVVSDAMDGLSLVPGSVSVTDASGNKVTGFSLQDTGSGFSLTLPEMDANSVDTVTYQAKVPDDFSGAKTTVSNHASASSGDITSDSPAVTHDYGVSVDKSGEVEGGQAYWTITIHNPGGMDLGGMTVSDILKKDGVSMPLPSSAQILSEDGTDNTITLPYTFPEGSTQKTYSITYQTDASETTQGYELDNQASVTNKKGETIGTQSVYKYIDQEPDYELSKVGKNVSANGDDLDLKWEVTFKANTEKQAPYTIGDDLNGAWMTSSQVDALKKSLDEAVGAGNYKLTTWPGSEAGSIGGFEIEFEKNIKAGDEVSFTLESTVKAPASGSSATQVYKNMVWSNGVPEAWGTNVYAPDMMVDKTATSAVMSANKENLILGWNVTIMTSATDGFAAPYTFEDKLEDGQWMTDAQIEALKAQLNSESDDNLGPGSYTLKTQGPSNHYTGFTITLLKDLPQFDPVAFSYESTGPLPENSDKKTYRNLASIDGGSASEAQSTYTLPAQKPGIIKCDAEEDDSTAALTYHDYYENGGVLEWAVKVVPTQAQKGKALTITDTLPEGLSLEDLSIALPDESGNLQTSPLYQDRKWKSAVTVDGQTYTADVSMSGRVITVTLPQELVPQGYNEEVVLNVKTRTDDPFPGKYNAERTTQTADFKNTASARAGSETIGEASQTQQVSKDTKTGFLSKSGQQAQLSNGGSALSYTVNVNPKAEDLIAGKNTVEATDTLTYVYDSQSQMNVGFDPASLRVEYKDGDGTYTPLPDSQWSYKIESEKPDYSSGAKSQDCYEKLIFTLPDNKAVRISYTYDVTGVPGTSGSLNNDVKITGYNQGASSKLQSKMQQDQGSGVGGSNDVYIKKVDQQNNQISLNGAVFTVYVYNPNAPGDDKFEEVGTFTSGTEEVQNVNGQDLADQDGICVMHNVSYNTAYKIEETQAPEGYSKSDAPYYFYVPSSNTQDDPLTMPAGGTEQIHPVNSFGEIIIPNVKKKILPETGSVQMLLLESAAYTAAGLFMTVGLKRKKESLI